MTILLTFLGGLKRLLSALWGFVARHPWQAACIALLCASLWLYAGKQDALAERDAARLTIKTERATYAKAQDDARKLALAEKARIEQRNKELADEADKTAGDLRARYHDAVVRLAAAQDRGRGANLPRTSDTASSGNGPGDSAVVPDGIMISVDDAQTCGVNTARLQAVRDWALSIGEVR